MKQFTKIITIQVVYKQKQGEQEQEHELLKFSNPASAETFLNSILKNPDVETAKKL